MAIVRHIRREAGPIHAIKTPMLLLMDLLHQSLLLLPHGKEGLLQGDLLTVHIFQLCLKGISTLLLLHITIQGVSEGIRGDIS